MIAGISNQLAINCRQSAARIDWLARLPDVIRELEHRWSLELGLPYESSAAWVTQVTLLDGTPAVLKLGMPHMESAHEIQGLRFWNGDPTVQLLDADHEIDAMLLERCEPGTALCELPETQQDVVIADLLRRLWKAAPVPTLFRPLSDLTAYWSQETLAQAERWSDAGLVSAGVGLFHDLSRNSTRTVLLATDLHAGNVLRARREPWLVIDPKPFVGDPAYDATQHLFNGAPRLRSDPFGTIRRFADLLEVDHERVRLWMFARAAAGPRDDWDDNDLLTLARAIG